MTIRIKNGKKETFGRRMKGSKWKFEGFSVVVSFLSFSNNFLPSIQPTTKKEKKKNVLSLLFPFPSLYSFTSSSYLSSSSLFFSSSE